MAPWWEDLEYFQPGNTKIGSTSNTTIYVTMENGMGCLDGELGSANISDLNSIEGKFDFHV